MYEKNGKIKNILIAGLFYIAARIIDTVLTAYSVNRYGVSSEGNPIVLLFMDLFGVNTGLVLNSIVELSILLPLCYKKERIFDVSAKNMLYILGIFHVIGAITHIYYLS